jgi:hypothetical protein
MKVYFKIVLDHHQWCQVLGSERLEWFQVHPVQDHSVNIL